MSEEKLYYPEALNQTKPCACGKVMILCETEHLGLGYPNQYGSRWACYGCGALKEGPTIHRHTKEDLNKQRWERVNKE